jgi:hypothetical protein
MNLTRLLPTLAAAVLALVLAAPSASAAQGSGGTPAEPPLRQGAGGGGVAPDGYGAADAAEAAESGAAESDGGGGAAPRATAGQEPTPTTPEGEAQPEEETPSGEGEGEETAPGETAPDPGPVGEAPAGADEVAGAIGFLPSTGLEVLSLAAIGIGLLLAGFALRPRRQVRAGRRRQIT